MSRRLLIASCVLFLAIGARAQEEEASSTEPAKGADRDEILAAIELPGKAQALRNKGVEKAQVREALRAARGKKLKAKQARDLLEGAEGAVNENGPIDNFGAFVKSKLAEGLRGRELASAIRAEHKARGKGKGKKGEPAKKEKRPKKERAGESPEEEEAAEPEDAESRGQGQGQGQGGRGRGRGGR